MPDIRPLRPGDPKQLGAYRLTGILGEGGQGVVYLAESEDETKVAVKLLRAHLSGDEKARGYFAKELAATRRVGAACTARVLDADVDGDTPYIVSEFVDGSSLADAVKAQGPLTGAELERLALGTIEAIIAIHEAGIVHRDFKPSNVLLGPDGPRVIDFGIARALDVTASMTSGVIGTPSYMAPEQLAGQRVGTATDIFAWAGTIVYAAIGRPPFGQDSLPAIINRVLNAPPDLGTLAPPLRDLVGSCLVKDPSWRPSAEQARTQMRDAGITGEAKSSPGWAPPDLTGPPVAMPQPGPAPAAGVPPQGMPPHGLVPPQGPGQSVPPRGPGQQSAAAGLPPVIVPPPRPPMSQFPTNPPAQPSTNPPYGAQSAATSPSYGPQSVPPPYGPLPPYGPQAASGRGPKKRIWLPIAAAAASVVLIAVAATVLTTTCCRDRSNSGSSGTGSTSAAFNAAVDKVVNASTDEGGTLKLTGFNSYDSLDPGDTYYAYVWNFSRLYARPLMTYKSAPGLPQLTPDLAAGPGTPSADLKTWTYRLRPGLKFQDGTPVTANQVKYAVARTFDSEVLVNGPDYFRQLLDAGSYPGPYQEKNLDKFTGVTVTGNDTVVFHLKKPFAEFDSIAAMPQTAPVPPEKDTGAQYTNNPMSTGPYKFESYTKGQSLTLTPNEYWGSDPNRKQLLDRIEVKFTTDSGQADNDLIAGTADLDLTGTGLQALAQARILSDTTLKRNADQIVNGFLRYIALSTKVAPLDNVHCRRAVQYAVNRNALVQAYGGGNVTEMATHMLPPIIPGSRQSNRYAAGATNTGDTEKAKQELASCGKQSGFDVNLALRSDRPKEVAAAEALRQSLQQVGIRVTLKTFPASDYLIKRVGSPSYVRDNKLGMMFYAWGADYPSGPGFFQLIADGRSITTSANNNISELNDPTVNGLIDKATTTADAAQRRQLNAQLDDAVMEQAAMLPIVFDKVLTYRSPRLANVYVNQAYGGYDFASLGVDD